MSQAPLLSIAIPAYARPKEIMFGLYRFIIQIIGRYEDAIEIVVSDDASPENSLDDVRVLAEKYKFVKYRRYSENIGLERNLIVCSRGCEGEFLWIFGDDDFLETADALDRIMGLLRDGKSDCYILNRTRRNSDLSRLISDNWMKLDAARTYEFSGLRDFCIKHGLISIIGFISVNIFRRRPYECIDASKFLGTMYPQLGALIEAFHDRPVSLVGAPLVCHRTQTADEKRAALGAKKTEADFMSDVTRRNATYFSLPFVSMIWNLIERGAFSPADMMQIPECTVINGLLIDFLIQTVAQHRAMQVPIDPTALAATRQFFAVVPLDPERRTRIQATLSSYPTGSLETAATASALPVSGAGSRPAGAAHPLSEARPGGLTISVITPSYNQGEFLPQCLASVRDQTWQPIEHLVFDPGSTDASRDIAASFAHVTLVAEPDEGQSDAVNKGFGRARGDIIAWVNSDDRFAHPHVFEQVVQRFLEPDAPDVVYGRGIYVDERGEKLRDVYINKNPSTFAWRFQHEDGVLQPAVFLRSGVVKKIGPLRTNLHYSMDYEYWIRCMKAGIRFAYVDEDLAHARYHLKNKTYGMRGSSYSEVCDMMKEHFGYVNHIWLKRYAEFLAEGHDGVLASVATAGVKSEDSLNREYKRLLLVYDTDYDTLAALESRSSERGYRDTLREMRNLGIKAQVPCRIVPTEPAHVSGAVCYTVGSRRWAYDAKWKAAEIAKSHAFLRRRIEARSTDTCIIVGNGPSLNRTNLSLLEGRDVIVSNNAFLSPELMKSATYYTVVNYLVAEQSSHHINRMERIEKILPYWLAYCLNPAETTHYVDAVGHAEFSRDMFRNMSWRHTVTFFNLHLAYGLGYRRVALIGMDHSYKQPGNVREQEIIQDYGKDMNHFHAAYFSGKKWQAADVDMMEAMYRLAKEAYEEDGRMIVNATEGGNLELFPRMPLEKVLADAHC